MERSFTEPGIFLVFTGRYFRILSRVIIMVGLTMSSASALAQSWSVTYFETETAAAREAHVTSDHMKNFRNTLMPIIGAMYDERIYTLVEIN